MKRFVLAVTLALAGTSAFAGIPSWGLPDLTFPDPVVTPDVSTQGCTPAAACLN